MKPRSLCANLADGIPRSDKQAPSCPKHLQRRETDVVYRGYCGLVGTTPSPCDRRTGRYPSDRNWSPCGLSFRLLPHLMDSAGSGPAKARARHVTACSGHGRRVGYSARNGVSRSLGKPDRGTLGHPADHPVRRQRLPHPHRRGGARLRYFRSGRRARVLAGPSAADAVRGGRGDQGGAVGGLGFGPARPGPLRRLPRLRRDLPRYQTDRRTDGRLGQRLAALPADLPPGVAGGEELLVPARRGAEHAVLVDRGHVRRPGAEPQLHRPAGRTA